MPLVFPLVSSAFMDLLPIASVSLELGEHMESSMTGGGELLTADLGPRLWRGELRLGRLTRAEADDAEALIDAVRGAGRSFMVYPSASAYPRLDPGGTLLGSAAPQIHTLDADRRQMRISALPAGYKLRRGDFLSFPYGTNPVRHALHRVVDAEVTASGTGLTPLFEVVPNIRPGAATGAAVRLVKPAFKALLTPGSVEPGSRSRFVVEGIGFSFQQTLR